MNYIIYLLISYILILLGTVFTHGFYSFGGVVCLIGAFLILIFSHNSKLGINKLNLKEVQIFLTLILIISTALSSFLYGGMYQLDIFNIYKISKILLALAFLISLSYLIIEEKTPKLIKKYRFGTMLLISIIVQVLMIASSPDPKIDIFRSLKYGTSALLSAKNPYTEIYPQVYANKIFNYFSYFPTILFFFLPFNALLGDPRFGLIFAQGVIVYLMHRLFILFEFNRQFAETLILIFVFYPLSAFITEQSFTDVIIVLGLVILLYTIFDKKFFSRTKIFLIAILIMNIKQILFFFFPIFLLKNKLIKNIFEFIKIYFLAFLISLPFIIWSWRDFFYDTILIYFQSPQGISFNSSLNIRSLVANFLKVDVNANIFLLIALIFIILILIKKTHNLYGIFESVSYFFFGYFLLGSFAYLNHYYLASCLLLVYIYSLFLHSNNDCPAKTLKKRDFL